MKRGNDEIEIYTLVTPLVDWKAPFFAENSTVKGESADTHLDKIYVSRNSFRLKLARQSNGAKLQRILRFW